MVDVTPTNPNQVFFGAWVTLEDDNGDENCYRIVGPDEINTQKGWISMDAPMARALMKKSVDDEITIRIADTERDYIIVDISYVAPE